MQVWQVSASDVNKIEVVWLGFFKRMIKGGYKLKNAPGSRNVNVEGEVDWSYKMSMLTCVKNKDLIYSTNLLRAAAEIPSPHLQDGK